MSSSDRTRRQISRRRFIGSAGAAAAGASALMLVGCGDDDDADPTSTPGGATGTTGTTGTATATATQGPRTGGTFRIPVIQEGAGLDPHANTSPVVEQMSCVYSSLGSFDLKTQKFEPLLAENIEQASPTEFVITLRKDVKWQNIAPVSGRAVTAEDVVYSLTRLRDHPKAAGGSPFLKNIIASMDVIDPTTLKITTKTPYADSYYDLSNIRFAVVAKEDVEQRGDLEAGGVGSGPYMIDEYEKGRGLTLARNPDYYEKPKPYPDKIEWQTITDNSLRFQAYKTEQFDIIGTLFTGYLEKLEYDELEDDKFVNTAVPGNGHQGLMLNAAKPPLDNPMVRQAIWLAIDQQQIIDKLFQGEGQKVAVLNPALDFWLLPEADLKPYITPDPAKAKQLLSAAGYEDGLDLELSFVTATYIPDEAELLIAQLKAAGINATAKAVETATWVNQYFLTKAYTLTITSVLENVTPTNNLLWFHSKGTGAYLNYSNPAAEALIDKQGTELDPEKRKQTVLEAQRTLLADWPALAPLPAKTLFSSHLARVGGIDFALRSNLLRHFDFYLKS